MCVISVGGLELKKEEKNINISSSRPQFSTIFAAYLFQAQIEIQSVMEENTYPLFLKSDLYLEYTRTGGESPKPNPSDQSPSSGPVKPVPGYLPTLAEDEEWR